MTRLSDSALFRIRANQKYYALYGYDHEMGTWDLLSLASDKSVVENEYYNYRDSTEYDYTVADLKIIEGSLSEVTKVPQSQLS